MIGSKGQITAGPSAETAITSVIAFVESSLPRWRDDPDRPAEEGETRLNSQLAKFLNSAAREELPMFCFHHEELQEGHRSVDLSAIPVAKSSILGEFYNKYTPIVVIECKRLPAPVTSRMREYVSSPTGSKGGIQRFKLGVHGASHSRATMVGYIQQGHAQEWFASINDWIKQLAAESDSQWNPDDQIHSFSRNAPARTARSESEHERQNKESAPIRLTHLWVEM